MNRPTSRGGYSDDSKAEEGATEETTIPLTKEDLGAGGRRDQGIGEEKEGIGGASNGDGARFRWVDEVGACRSWIRAPHL